MRSEKRTFPTFNLNPNLYPSQKTATYEKTTSFLLRKKVYLCGGPIVNSSPYLNHKHTSTSTRKHIRLIYIKLTLTRFLSTHV